MQTDLTSESQEPKEPSGNSYSSSVATQLELTIFNPVSGTLAPAFRFEEDDIVINDNLSHEEWTDGLKLFKWAQTKLKMGFAKYVQFGTLKYGKDKVEASLSQLEFNMPIVTAALAINSIPENIRHENLHAEHYVVLARSDISTKDQTKWSKIASEQLLTPTQLKASIEAGEVITEATAKKNTHGIISIHGLSQEAKIWMDRVGGAKGIKKMRPEDIAEIISLLKPLADLYHELSKPKRSKKPR